MHTHFAINMIYLLILSGILLYITAVAEVNALQLNIAVKSGSSCIVPCVYSKDHKKTRKYLCQGRDWSSCRILAYAPGKTGKYSITDYPDRSIFTAQWDNLMETSDYGYYWCAVEIGGYGTPDAGYYLYLTVQSAPDVSVKSSSVSGYEGDTVSVQCFYTSGYQNKLKQWCRIKEQRCYTVGRTDTSQHSSVQISDDGRSSFTVLMTGLRLSDSGWYYCSAGDLQVSVQLMVQRDNKTYTNTSESDTSSDEDGPSSNSKIAINDTEDAWSDHRNRVVLLLWTALPLLTLVLVIWRIIQKHNLPTQGRDVCSETEGHVVYDTVVFKKGKNNEQQQVSISSSRPPDQEEVIYSALKLH